MAAHSSTLAWKIPWTEEPGRLQTVGSQRIGNDWATSLSLFTFMHWRRKWQLTPVFLPGESQGQRSLVGCRLWGPRVGHDWSDLAAAAAGYIDCSNPPFSTWRLKNSNIQYYWGYRDKNSWWSVNCATQWFSTGQFCLLGTAAMSGDISDCYDWGMPLNIL